MVDFKSTGRFETVGSEVTEVGRVYQMAVDEWLKALSAKTTWMGDWRCEKIDVMWAKLSTFAVVGNNQ